MGPTTTTIHTDLNDNDGLRQALAVLAGLPATHRRQHPLWGQLGLRLHSRAHHKAATMRRHREDYTQEFVLAALTFLTRRLDYVARAPSPWGLLVTIGDRAGKRAVTAHDTGGLTRLPAGGQRPQVVPFDPTRHDRAPRCPG